MTTVFREKGHMVDLLRYRATFGERNVVEQIKSLIFFEAVLVIEITEAPQKRIIRSFNILLWQYLENKFKSEYHEP